MTEEYDPYALVNAKLDKAMVGNEPLMHLVLGYTEALKHHHRTDADRISSELDSAMKDAGIEYLDRLQVKRMLHEEAEAARENGVRRTLVKQVSERHEGR
jgi:hypothetical protein